jgi:hypothetical protein
MSLISLVADGWKASHLTREHRRKRHEFGLCGGYEGGLIRGIGKYNSHYYLIVYAI